MLANNHPAGVLARLFASRPDTAGSPPPLKSYGRKTAPYYLPGFSPPPPEEVKVTHGPADPLGEALRRSSSQPEDTAPKPSQDPACTETPVADKSQPDIDQDTISAEVPADAAPAEERPAASQSAADRKVFRARPVVEQMVAAASDAARLLEAASPEHFEVLGDDLIAGQAAQVLMHLRRGEWQASGAYRANLFVLSYELFSDGAGELVGKTAELAERLDDRGLVKVASGDGVTCVGLSSRGRGMADRMLSPLSREGDIETVQS